MPKRDRLNKLSALAVAARFGRYGLAPRCRFKLNLEAGRGGPAGGISNAHTRFARHQWNGVARGVESPVANDQ
jgi:hypothetical protein